MLNMSTAAKIKLETAPFSVVRAIALSLARDIDRGATELRDELERVMNFAKTAEMERF